MSTTYCLFFHYPEFDREYFYEADDLNTDEIPALVDALNQEFDAMAVGFNITAVRATELDPAEYLLCRTHHANVQGSIDGSRVPLGGYGCEDPQHSRRIVAYLRACFFHAEVLKMRDLSNDSEFEKICPNYDKERRELWYGETLIKRFKQSAGNQERLLTAFQEDGWKTRIYNPFPPRRPKVLSETIRALNGNMKINIIKFELDGTGDGIIWRRIAPS